MSVGIKQTERARIARSRGRSPHRSRGFTRVHGFTLVHLMIAIAAVGMMLSASISIFGAEVPLRQASHSPGHKRIAQRQGEPRGADARAADARAADAHTADATAAGARAADAQQALHRDAPLLLRASVQAEQTTR